MTEAIRQSDNPCVACDGYGWVPHVLDEGGEYGVGTWSITQAAVCTHCNGTGSGKVQEQIEAERCRGFEEVLG